MSQEVEHRVYNIALLVADTPPSKVTDKFGDYTKIYPKFLNDALATIPRFRHHYTVELNIVPFNVRNMEYPNKDELAEGKWDLVLITGSTSNAYEDNEWTNKVAEFVRYVAEDHPLVRIVGICWGHQIVARAFGSKVEANPQGWELGVYDADLSEEGHELLDGYLETRQLRLQQVHRDIVTDVPPDLDGEEFLNLASTPKCKVQALGLKYITEAPPLPSKAGTSSYMAFDVDDHIPSSGPAPVRSLHIFTNQGHPEFSEELVALLASSANETEMGEASDDTVAEYLNRAQKPADSGAVGAVILGILGYEPARDEGGPTFSGR